MPFLNEARGVTSDDLDLGTPYFDSNVCHKKDELFAKRKLVFYSF